MKRRFFVLLVFLYSSIALSYSIKSPSSGGSDENLQLLQKISRGVSKIANDSEKALVYISIYKTVRQGNQGYIDPFEFFFGPDFRRQIPPQQQERRAPERREGGLGSGFIIDLDKGYIMTNNHVVQEADEIELKFANGESEQGTIVGRDQNTDVAIVQVKNKNFKKSGLGELSLGDSDTVGKGDFVLALGAPFGLESSISFGIVSAISRGNLDITNLGNFIQTDAAINPGNSGGPLLNTAGQVIGVNTAIFSRSGAYNGIGFAIPSNLARKIGEQIINGGKVVRGYIGVQLQPIDEELHKALNLPKDSNGALVREVSRDTPASKAGLKAGDVIVSIEGRNMRSSSEVVNVVGLAMPGQSLDFGIFRDGKRRNMKVKVEQRPDDLQASNEDRRGRKGGSKDDVLFGLSLEPVTDGLRKKYGFQAQSGLVVSSVDQGSEAERVGLQPGDVLVEVNNQLVKDVAQFKKIAARAGQRLLIRVERKGVTSFIALKK